MGKYQLFQSCSYSVAVVYRKAFYLKYSCFHDIEIPSYYVSPTTLSRYQGMIKRYIKSNFKVIVFVHHCRLPHKIKKPLWRGQHP